MSIWKVKTDTLNLRSTPAKEDDNIIRALPLAQEVDVIAGTAANRWWEVKTLIDGVPLSGYVSAAFLRKPVSTLKETLMSVSVAEWLRFKQGNGEEADSPFYKYVGEYWQSIGHIHDGRDVGIPWSAAFISFAVRQAGYSNFKFAAAHHFYIRDAIDKRKSGDVSVPFWGFKLNDHKPQLGDMVCQWRGTPVTFDSLPSGGFKSHCDIIVEIRDNEVRAIGGNVGNSVSISAFQLDASGFLKPGKVFAILRNNN
jgi:hypothetical protein